MVGRLPNDGPRARRFTGARADSGGGDGAADDGAAVTDFARDRFSGSARDSGGSSTTTTTFFLRGALSFAPAGRPPLLFASGSVLTGSCGSASGVVEGVFSTTSTTASSIFVILLGF